MHTYRYQRKTNCVRIDFLREDMLRIRMAPRAAFSDSALNHYGFIREPRAAKFTLTGKQQAGGLVLETAAVKLEIPRQGGGLKLLDKRRRITVLRQTGTQFTPQAAHARFRAADDEDWIGFGDQTRERLYHRGSLADLWVRNVKSYAPVPFFMSTRGVGTLVNTTHHLVCDMCRTRPHEYSWADRRGVIDYYLFVGAKFTDLLSAYTDLTGKPRLPPLWSFGLWYLCRTQANNHEAVQDAYNFRREEIPCDVLGLEPGWMETNYDYSLDKRWSSARFYIPSYAPHGPNNFINALKRMGFKLELWLCNNYDLTWEEERRNRLQTSGPTDLGAAGNYRAGHEVDEHFRGSDLLDKITRPAEPWFKHLEKFVDQGADFFKQDGALQVVEHPDRLAGNGMLDAELHNLYPLLYSRQMYEGFAAHARRRPLVFTVAGWTGFQAWCGTWAGDTGGGLDTIGGLLNQALVGQAWVTNDMEVHTKSGIHFGYLQPWSQINSWNYFRMPWLQGRSLLEMHRCYAQLRARLVPYLYAWAYQATLTAIPLMRPLTLEFQDDRSCRAILHQYLLGRDLMIVTFKPQAYFPGGRWKDFWTGAIVPAGRSGSITWPEERGGGLYLREGGIVPLGPVMQFRGEKPMDEIEIHAFPGSVPTSLDFYEDDGITFEHQRGRHAITTMHTGIEGRRVMLSVGKTRGHFDGMTSNRRWQCIVTMADRPRRILLNGRRPPDDSWHFDEQRGELRLEARAGPLRLVAET
ncbi:MAG: TIM-barrel domain-containing protein [Kiritimatiellia bacterium]|nr:DUF5110 domain-containing protein [Lentisphaerota bacterium]